MCIRDRTCKWKETYVLQSLFRRFTKGSGIGEKKQRGLPTEDKAKMEMERNRGLNLEPSLCSLQSLLHLFCVAMQLWFSASPWATEQLRDFDCERTVFFFLKLKNVSCEYDRLNGWNSTLQAAWYTRHVRIIWFLWTKPTIWLLILSFTQNSWKTSAVSTTVWMVETQLCNLRGTSDAFV